MIIPTQGTIIEEATNERKRGVYERSGKHFVFTLTANSLYCFCQGREHADIDRAWQLGYREELTRGDYTL